MNPFLLDGIDATTGEHGGGRPAVPECILQSGSADERNGYAFNGNGPSALPSVQWRHPMAIQSSLSSTSTDCSQSFHGKPSPASLSFLRILY